MPKRQLARRRRRAPRKKYPLYQPVPDSKVVKMRYVDQFTIDPGLGTAGHISLRANGLFDPYVPVGGHQPYSFDQYMEFYNRYTVLGSKITVTFSAGTQMTVGINLTKE